MSADSWERMAVWYDERQGDAGDFWHRTLIDPAFLRLVGDVRGLRVLDLGCGNGYLSRRYARDGAKVVGVDASTAMIERARARESKEPLGIEYHVADAVHLTFVPDNRIDLVASNMALMDIEDGRAAIREAARVVRRGGRFVASLSHPCFDQGATSTWLTERSFRTTKTFRKIERYREPFAEEIPWELEPGRILTTTGYHRPLAWYSRTLRDAGFVIRTLDEPEPTQEFVEGSPQGSFIAGIPLHLVIEAVKI